LCLGPVPIYMRFHFCLCALESDFACFKFLTVCAYFYCVRVLFYMRVVKITMFMCEIINVQSERHILAHSTRIVSILILR
jgi:hypothetical protein